LHIFTFTLDGISFAEEDTGSGEVAYQEESSGADQAAPPANLGAASLSMAQMSGPGAFSTPISAIQNFQADPSTGMASTAIPIAVPPGRRNLQPNISLNYSSSSKNSWIGFGWMLEMGHISRSTKDGVPSYTNADTFCFVSGGTNIELVDIGGGEYRSRIESAFMRFSSDGSSWIVTDKGGTQYHFGTTGDSRLVNAGGTFKWFLDKVIDTHDNYMTVAYYQDYANGQIYPEEIAYTGNEATGAQTTNSVQFILEENEREDIVSDYRSGYRIATTKRLKEIATWVSGELAAKYEFEYKYSSRTGRSLLEKVTGFGKDGISSLPPTLLTYSDEQPLSYTYQYTAPSQGDNLWNARFAAGFDRGHENFGPVPPPAFDVTWGPTYTQSSYSGSGWDFSIDSNGSLQFSSAQDCAIHFWTYFYVEQDETINISPIHNGGGEVGYYLNGDYTQSVVHTWQLEQGYNLMEITGYHQHSGYSTNLNYAFAGNVDLMNSSQLTIPQLSADFNSDGITDLGTYFASGGNWTVSLSQGANFQPEEIWIEEFGQEETPMLGDFDADGKMDICSFDRSEGNWQVALSDGASFQAQPYNWLPSFGQDEKPISGDFNGDGIVDIGYFDGDNGDWYVALSDGSAFYDDGLWLSGFGAAEAAYAGDFNGDGFTDAAYFDQDSGNWYVSLSNGRGFVKDTSPWITGFGAGFDGIILDYNGDGFTDVGYFDKANSKVVVAGNRGSRFEDAGDWITGLTVSGTDCVIQTGDFNGDGLVDPFVYNTSTQENQRGLSTGTPSDLLTDIDNGFGGVLSIQYSPSSVYDNTGDDDIADIPFVFQTIRETTLNDGMGNSYTTNYHYKGALYDTDKKEFWGFAYVKITDGEGNYTETYFRQDDEVFKGRPDYTETKDKEGNLYTKTEFTWLSTSPHLGVDFPYLYETSTYTYDGDASYRQISASYEYDEYGNVTKVTEEGDVNLSGDERETITDYAYNTTDWIVGLPCHVLILDDENNRISEKWLYYDYNEHWTYAPTKGDLTKEEVWLDTIEGRISTTSTYDNYGNVKSVTDARSHTIETDYETTYHTYPERITNDAGHVVETTYDPKTGQALTSEDPNGQIAETIYDVFGRPIKVIGPNDTEALPGAEYEYDLTGFPNKVITYTRVVSGVADVLTSYSFYDGLGRLIQAKTEAEEASQQILSGVAVYDHRSLVNKQYLPYYVDKTSDYTEPDYDNKPYVEFEYDCLGRTTKVINPDGTFSTTEYSDWTITQTDENTNYTTRINDAYGRVIEVREYDEGVMHTTGYTYDSLGNLTNVIDEHGNESIISYDSLGRKISMDDPDMGQWSYEYDAVGNLVGQTDAKSQTIQFTYDEINRLEQKSYPDGTPVNYTYDDPAVPFSKGRLTEVTDASGSTSFYYDNLGREIRTEKIIEGANHTVERTYDALDRLTSIKYPDDEVVNYTYNRQGGMETVYSAAKAYVNDVDYNAMGQMTYIQYGNGTYTNYTYDSETTRLSNLKTNNGSLQNLTYTFDDAGNVTRIEDGVNTATQDFIYDDLNRLVRAAGAYGTIDYEYDAIGNLKRKGSATFEYGENGAGPHAVTSSSTGKTFSYDDNGNMIMRGGQELEYDYENRLTSVVGQANIEVRFEPGWNFFSIPIIPDDPDVEGVLSGLTFGSDYSQVSRYNAETDEFENYVNNPKFNDFDTLEYGKGYQIYVTNPAGCVLTLSGSAPQSNSTAELKQDWNIIGSPTASEIPVVNALSNLQFDIDYDKVARYNPITETYEYYQNDPLIDDFDTFEKGKGYTIHCLKDTSWTISQQSGSATYLYDGDGGRVKKTEAGVTTTYVGSLYEVNTPGVAEGLPGGGLMSTTKHIFLGPNRICSVDSGPSTVDYYFFHGDHLGSSNIVTDEAGAQVQLLEYTPYGTTSRNEGSYDTNYRFTGKELDQGTGLYFYGARYYDPEIGRFITPDSIVQAPYDPQSLNRYTYCRNNPVKYTDPTGHIFGIDDIIIGAILGAIIGGISAAVTGGNIGEGILTGAIGGAIFGYVGYLDFASSFAQTMAHGVGGALSGGISAAIQGGDIGRGALIGGLSAGAGEFLGSNVPFLQPVSGNGIDAYLANVSRRAAIGAIVGGTTSAALGGSFGSGAQQGGITAAIAYTANHVQHELQLTRWLMRRLAGFAGGRKYESGLRLTEVEARSGIVVDTGYVEIEASIFGNTKGELGARLAGTALGINGGVERGIDLIADKWFPTRQTFNLMTDFIPIVSFGIDPLTNDVILDADFGTAGLTFTFRNGE